MAERNSKVCISRKFELTQFGEIKDEPTEWIINGVLPMKALASIYGAPSSAKTFLALAIAACVSNGAPWFGHLVHEGTVIYLAGEGHQGLNLRGKAWEKTNAKSLKDSPLYISNGPVDLTDPKLLKESIINEINRVSVHGSPVLVIIDTMGKHFGGKDENLASDMFQFVMVMDLIRSTYGCAILIIHHTGKAASKGARGSNFLQAALDTEIEVTKQETQISVKNTKMRDSRLFPKMAFQLREVQLLDLDNSPNSEKENEPVTTCVLELTDNQNPFTETKIKPSGKNQKQFDKIFSELSSKGEQEVDETDIKELMDLQPKRFDEIKKSRWFLSSFQTNDGKIIRREPHSLIF